MKKKIEFAIVGAQKSGTTAMKKFLSHHPEISFSDEKEVHFFIKNKYVKIGNKMDYRPYLDFYANADSQTIWGDKSPSYLYFEGVAERIWSYNADMKIIILLRNPVDRAYSQYQMLARRDDSIKEFISLVKNEKDYQLENAPRQYRQALIARGYYVEQIRRYIRCFPAKQIKILKYEEFRLDPQQLIDDVCSFLCVSKLKIKDIDPLPEKKYPPMSIEDRKYVTELFYYEVKSLEKMLNWNCDDWLEYTIN